MQSILHLSLLLPSSFVLWVVCLSPPNREKPSRAKWLDWLFFRLDECLEIRNDVWFRDDRVLAFHAFSSKGSSFPLVFVRGLGLLRALLSSPWNETPRTRRPTTETRHCRGCVSVAISLVPCRVQTSLICRHSPLDIRSSCLSVLLLGPIPSLSSPLLLCKEGMQHQGAPHSSPSH